MNAATALRAREKPIFGPAPSRASIGQIIFLSENSFNWSLFYLTLFLVQGLPVAFYPNRQGDHGEEHDLPELQADVDDVVPFQQNATDDAQKMRERKSFPDDLRPVRHAAEWKHEAGKKDRGKKNKESHLARLQLVFRDG